MKEIKFKGFCPNEQGTTTIYAECEIKVIGNIFENKDLLEER